jgi:hypothetical protein
VIDFGININTEYVMAFVMLSYGLRDLSSAVLLRYIPKLENPRRYGVFFVALVLAVPFSLFDEVNTSTILNSYCFGTSMYEIVIDLAMKKVKEMTVLVSEKK